MDFLKHLVKLAGRKGVDGQQGHLEGGKAGWQTARLVGGRGW